VTRSHLLALAAALLLFAACPREQSRSSTLNVVTTLDVLAHWVSAVGGDRVTVSSLVTGYEDPHNFEPKPSDVERIARARLLVRVGLGLEEWLDGLVANANNPTLVVLDVADGADVIDAGDGHEHDAGNPHVWLDPVVAQTAVGRIAAELARLDPKGESLYTARAAAYAARLDSVTAALQAEVAALPDRRFIGFHDAWPYFNRRFGFVAAANIEPIPGQEPSARTLADLVELARRERIRVVVTEPQLPSDLPATLAREAGIRVVTLSALRADSAGSDPYMSLLDEDVRRLAAALRE
jgi:ABC-type Zn uptake system ZnuABC Zn-binding protein ZnuA